MPFVRVAYLGSFGGLALKHGLYRFCRDKLARNSLGNSSSGMDLALPPAAAQVDAA